jgi:hypothetical protein
MAREFDRTSVDTGQYISCGTSSSLNPANNLTYACWVNFNTRPNEAGGGAGGYTAQFLISRDGASTNRCASLILQAYQGTAHTFLGGINKNNTTGSEVRGTTVAAINTWYHVALTYKFVTDGTSELRLYVNGAQEASSTSAVGPINQATVATELGRRVGVNRFPLEGRLAEVAIYNTTLSAAEVASLADGMTPDKVSPQGLVLYAPLVRDLIDLKGNTLTNFSTTVANHPRVYA